MRKKILSLFLFFLIKASYGQEAFSFYIRKFAPLAVREMHRSGIPSSIKLAQGILESSFGESHLAKNTNNHFGIKCGSTWVGKSFFHDDDSPKECFRKYDSILESFLDHSNFLKKPRYSSLFLLPKNDYKAWAVGLKKAGYATAFDYADRLIKTIEKYKLWVFDHELPNGLENKIDQYLVDLELVLLADFKENKKKSFLLDPKNLAPKDRIFYHDNGGKKYIIVSANESLEEISKKLKISIKRLIFYNDLSIDKKLREGQNLFLEAKNSYGNTKFYKVDKDEDMYLIAQKVGIKLSNLYSRNLMQMGAQPKEGEILYLKGRKKRFKR